ncbi:Anti-repressor SinI [Gracilibacillus ureilyticus]|uniref:Anti-repressor SinI n=1 Tax=Gracilibacillus ureilyticus TaxID=531814 RepID=A0A1H9V374_9BACI|nr:anti-repressor SinI family protein [Gracilibacillus ureilyticus]SES16029.1 Anti-repressor SinI [Gracilibacillus ureilyticus]
MLDAMQQNSSHEQKLDKEWLILLMIAKKQGISKQQVRDFIIDRKLNKDK